MQVGRFVSESEVVSTDVIEGNLFTQVEKTIEILRIKYLENRFYYEGIRRKEDMIYPEDALREAVITLALSSSAKNASSFCCASSNEWATTARRCS